MEILVYDCKGSVFSEGIMFSLAQKYLSKYCFNWNQEIKNPAKPGYLVLKGLNHL